MTVRDQNGSVAIEFAIVTLFILVPLLLGTVDLAIAVYNKQIITNASREGARAGIARSPIPIPTVVANYCAGRLISGSGGALTCTGTFSGGGDFQNDLTVTATYEHHFLFGGIFGLSPITMTEQTLMKMEPLPAPGT